MGKTHEALQRAEAERAADPSAGFAVSGRSTGNTAKNKGLQSKRFAPYREILARLDLPNSRANCAVLAITGSAKGVGNSSTAYGLAETLANQTEQRILLVDCDPSPHSLSTKLGKQSAPGLLDYVCDTIESTTPFHQFDQQENLLFLPNGTARISTLQDSLSRQRIEQLFEKLRNLFGYVVLDLSPVHEQPESRLLLEPADGTILTLHSGRTRGKVVSSLIGELESIAPPVLGVVLSRRRYHIPKWLYERL